MPPISRGFRGRRPQVDATRVPPGQYVTTDFPVLSAGPTPHTPLDEWTFSISGAVDERISWTWQELLALPAETPTVDIHCVTKWSKLDTTWKGVSVDTLLSAAKPLADATHVLACCHDEAEPVSVRRHDRDGHGRRALPSATSCRCAPVRASRPTASSSTDLRSAVRRFLPAEV